MHELALINNVMYFEVSNKGGFYGKKRKPLHYCTLVGDFRVNVMVEILLTGNSQVAV